MMQNNINSNSQPIGILLPISRGESGYFKQSFSLLDQIKTNLNILFRTKRGERRMNTEFGSGLWELVFDMNNDVTPQIVESAVRKDVERWMPYVNIENVTVRNDSTDRDNYRVLISINFTANSIGIKNAETITVDLQQGAI